MDWRTVKPSERFLRWFSAHLIETGRAPQLILRALEEVRVMSIDENDSALVSSRA